jgi:hypothetical protein
MKLISYWHFFYFITELGMLPLISLILYNIYANKRKILEILIVQKS